MCPLRQVGLATWRKAARISFLGHSGSSNPSNSKGSSNFPANSCGGAETNHKRTSFALCHDVTTQSITYAKLNHGLLFNFHFMNLHLRKCTIVYIILVALIISFNFSFNASSTVCVAPDAPSRVRLVRGDVLIEDRRKLGPATSLRRKR